MTNTDSSVPKPSPAQVKHYLDLWDSLENNHLQEDALNRLFFKLAPGNEDVTDILLKASTLNDFYSTNIFSIFPVAKHIQSLHIDERLKAGDTTLVGDIQHLTINGVEKNFYSFATKYCSHHNPLEYPIYDSYVDRVLRHYRDQDGFAEFKNEPVTDYIDALYAKIKTTDDKGRPVINIDFARYPFSVDGESHFYISDPENVVVDIEKLAEWFQQIRDSLDGLYYMYSDEWENA